jgi:hypothetical protein
MSPHRSAIFLQHSRSADVIAAPGNTQAATGSAASISARAETPSLVNSLNITSLPLTVRRNRREKVSPYSRYAHRPTQPFMVLSSPKAHREDDLFQEG